MKMFNRVLAVILSLVMLLSVVPVAVFAADNGSTNTGNGSTVGAGQSTAVTIPVQVGTGSSGTVTLTLDAKELVAALKGDKSMDALKALIKDAVSTTNSDIITLDDLLALVPVSDIVGIILKDIDKETFEAIAEKVLPAISGEDLREFASKLDADTINQDAALDFFESKLEDGDLEEVVAAYFVGVTFEQILEAYINDRDNGAVVVAEAPVVFSMKFLAAPAAEGEESDSNLQQLVKDLLNGDPDMIQDFLKQEGSSEIVGDFLAKEDSAEIVEDFLQKEDNKTVVQDFLSNEDNAAVIEEIRVTQPEIVESAGGAGVSNEALIDHIINNSDALNTVVKENIVTNNVDKIVDHVVKNEETLNKVVDHVVNDEAALNKVVDHVASDENAKNQVQQHIIKSEDVKKYIMDNYSDKIDIEKILNDPSVNALDFINLDKLTTDDYNELMKLVGTTKLIGLLKDDLSTLITADTIKTVVEKVAFSMLANVNVIAINGYKIGSKPTPVSNLTLDMGEVAGLIKSLVPRLTEFGNTTDGKILSLNFYAEYTDANDSNKTIVKDINVDVVVEGDLSVFRAFAKKLADYISVYNEGTDLYIDVTMPAVFTRALAWYLEDCPYGEELKDDILGLPDKTGAELVAELENLTWDKVVELLKRVDIEELYTYVTNLSKVEYVLETLQNKLGFDYKLEDLQDINNLLGEIADGTPRLTFENVCDYISKRVNADVMDYLGKGTAFIDNSETVKAYLNKLEKTPYIGAYIAKYNNEVSLNEILNTYKGLEAAEAMAIFVEKAVGKDLEAFLQNNTVNEIYDRMIEEVEERSSTFNYIFERIKDYMLAAVDPDYVATSTWGKIVQTLIPDQIFNLADKSFANTYRGNGKFEIIDKNFNNVNLGDKVDKLIAKFFDVAGLDSSYKEMIDMVLPTDSLNGLNFGLHFSVTIPNISRATFMCDDEVTKDMDMFVPNGVNLGRFHAPGEEFSFWIDADDNIVTRISGDITLYPVRGFISGGFLDVDGNNWTVTSKKEKFTIKVNVSNPTHYEMIEALNSLTFANLKGLTMTMDDATIDGILNNGTTRLFIITYDFSTNNVTITSENGGYTYTPDRIEKFGMSVDGAPFEGEFAGIFKINIPCKTALDNDKNELSRTNIYNVVDGVIMNTETLSVVSKQGKSVVLNAKHFSDYIVVNEYKYKTLFVDTDNEELKGEQNKSNTAADGYVPAKAQVKIAPKLAYRPGKRIASVNYNGTNIALGKVLTMPATSVIVTCTVEMEGAERFNVFGTTYNTFEEANAALIEALAAGNLPKGYTVVLPNVSLYTTDTVVYDWVKTTTESNTFWAPKLEPITFEITFPDDTKKAFTVETLNSYVAPSVPTIKGNNAYWAYNGQAIGLADIVANTTITELTQKVAITATAGYTPIVYSVFLPDGTSKPTAFGEQFAYTAPTGMEATYVILSNDNKNGNKVEAVDGVITMPAYDVKVIEVAKEVSYTIYDGKTTNHYTGIYGDSANFTVSLVKGEALLAQPNVGTISSFIINPDGSKTLTYSFRIEEDLAILYATDPTGIKTVQLVNGMVNTDTATNIKNLAFVGFSDAISFESANYQFALFKAEQPAGSLLWLWILIALVVIIGLIALLYNLYIREKLKPNFVTRFVTWIVSMFFNACLAVSTVALWIAQGTAKKGKVDYQEFGMATPEELRAAEDAEAAAAAEAEAEEVAEESVEEEIVEETANDAEEVAEDATAAFETVETEDVAVDKTVDAVEETVETVGETAEIVDETAETVAETDDQQN